MKIKIFDTLSHSKLNFEPLNSKKIRMYVCGPTVYDFAHIGNGRPIIVFDVLFRLLRSVYGINNVSYVRNITDIDDKIIVAANKLDIDTETLTKKTISNFHEDIESLNVLKPTHEPKATESIAEMILLIEDLIKKDIAYIAENHVLFDTKKFKDYGKLSKRSQEDMIAGSRIEIAPYKKNPFDFVLWKPSKKEEPYWDSPWGRGRPGWHIECSAMTKKFLGESFDIHAGGADLIFPHHENEIAQSESSHQKQFSKYWMHNGYLNIEGEKMSKSLGNILTIRDLLKKYNGEILRFAMLSTHYRKPINFSKDLLSSSYKQLHKIYSSLNSRSLENKVTHDIPNSLLDDMNTPLAIAEIHELVKKLNDSSISDNEWIECKSKIKRYGDLMGLFMRSNFQELEVEENKLNNVQIKEIENLIKERNLARQSGNFELADEIRGKLEIKGVILEDKGDNTTWKIKNEG
ncbi:MAG: Cysteine--tRNA ligase [Alphaproteobacteria bacterium MarineAlpha5_Bin12]|nr:MAG: Cysteine--tRNA ligase [Alphaproteobacteria bacterium MarineAlpha5_Bin12]|tara:strand:+ start:18725 stop:20107 length:1383 start_codon:yes stop_codon:yes gene_type:complete